VGMRPRTDRQTDIQTRVTAIHFASSTTHARNVTTPLCAMRPVVNVVVTRCAGAERFSSYCETESFNASCPADHVIIMTHARYGRMQLSRCVKMDYGHIGCAADVIEAADWRCSGRRRCRVRVPDAEFARNKPCPDDLKPYLEAAYVCVRG